MMVGRGRRALIALLVAVASPLAAQDTTLADLEPGARVRVWYAPYRLRGTAGVMRSRTADTIRFRAPSEQQRRANEIDDYHIPIAGIEQLDVGAGRDPKAAWRGGIVGFTAGYAIGLGLTVLAHQTTGRSETRTPLSKLQPWNDRGARWVGLLFGTTGAAIGGIRNANASERWHPVRLR